VAVNIDFSRIECSTKTDTPRTHCEPGKNSVDDVYIDVTHESEIAPVVSVKSGSRPLISRRDQLTLFSVLLLLSAAFLSGHLVGKSSTKQLQLLPAYQVDLNSAGLEELVLLEGIGELTAEKIVLDRQVNGPYLTEDQLQRVKGIGPKTLERLREHIVCR